MVGVLPDDNPLMDLSSNFGQPEVTAANIRWLRSFVDALDRDHPKELALMGLDLENFPLGSRIREHNLRENLDLAHWRITLNCAWSPSHRLSDAIHSMQVIKFLKNGQDQFGGGEMSFTISFNYLLDALSAIGLYELGEDAANDGLGSSTATFETVEQEFSRIEHDINAFRGGNWASSGLGPGHELRFRSTRAANLRRLNRVAEAQEQEAVVFKTINTFWASREPDEFRHLVKVSREVSQAVEPILRGVRIIKPLFNGSAEIPGEPGEFFKPGTIKPKHLCLWSPRFPSKIFQQPIADLDRSRPSFKHLQLTGEYDKRPANECWLGYCVCDELTKLTRCASCLVAQYCGREHQTAAWKAGHKYVCKTLVR